MKILTTDELIAARPGPLKLGPADTTARGYADLEETAAGDLIDEEPEETAANEADPTWPTLLAALSADLRPLGQALESAMNAGDAPAIRAALRKISAAMPEFVAGDNLTAEISAALTAALTEDTTTEEP